MPFCLTFIAFLLCSTLGFAESPKLEDNLIPLGNSFSQIAGTTVANWIRGDQAPMPRLLDNVNSLINQWTHAATTPMEAQYLKEITEGKTPQISTFLLGQAREHLRFTTQLGIESKSLNKYIDQIQNSNYMHRCEIEVTDVCNNNTALLFGVYTSVKRITWMGVLSNPAEVDAILSRLTLLLLHQKTSNEKRGLIFLLYYLHSNESNFLENFRILKDGSKSEGPIDTTYLNSQFSASHPFANTNSWRILSAILKNLSKNKADADDALAQSTIERMTKLIEPSLNEMEYWKKNNLVSYNGLNSSELYVDIELMAEYLRFRGQLTKAESLRIIQGNLRSTQSELINSPTERFFYKLFWGFPTDYGTSIHKVGISVLIYFLTIWLLSYIYWGKFTTYRKQISIFGFKKSLPFIKQNITSAPSRSFETAVLFITIRDDDKISNKKLVNFLRLSSTFLITCALAYLIAFISRSF
ncbi:hypothetical protein [Bdellovibrio sp. NC01]|uniref:hypothetical protein n=1 Tax=Bdellovibrio sp. NC01 TaxID=2220073 RepID=UPI001158F01E|nr:hypothetical protein [Bdellovibrio sp. NC01]QDK37915.1 hypothetical protein DOE51_10130 [Bdellovibrio sp. NC01]